MAKNNEKTTNVANNEVNNNEVNNNEVNNNEVNNAEKVDAKAQKDQSKKVSAKVAVKATNTISRFIKSERIGVNATIRILLDAANDGNEDAINTLCALCDVPTDMAFSITLDDVRKAVNEWYPYVIQMQESKRKINVRAKCVYVSTPSDEKETDLQARNRVEKCYFATEVKDYLSALTAATKARAKNQKQRIVEENKVYKDKELDKVQKGVTVDKIRDAHERKTFLWSAVNVWKKNSLLGYYI